MTTTGNIPAPTPESTLEHLLERGLSSRLTIVAGLESSDCSQALDGWLSHLDFEALLIHCPDEHAGDTCPQRIVEAFAAVGMIDQGEGMELSAETCQATLVQLLNSLAALPRDLVVVLLDYREDEAADQVVSYLLEHLPHQIHLYLISEDMPSLSCIPRLRVRRELQLIDARSG